MRNLAQLESSTLELIDIERRCWVHQIRLRNNFISLQSLILEGKTITYCQATLCVGSSRVSLSRQSQQPFHVRLVVFVQTLQDYLLG
jgi:hypothetical protein